ncbi:MAG: nickel/cobalt transporter [Dehalococcoidia bacterium]
MSLVVSRRWRLRILAALAVLTLALAPSFARTTFAHPLGNFTENRYARLEVYADRVQVHYVVDMAEIPTFQAMPGIDTDGDGAASEAELAAFAAKTAKALPARFELTVDGKETAVATLESTAQLLPGQGGLDVLRIVAVYDAPIAAKAGTNLQIGFTDSNFSGNQGWREIIIKGSEGAAITADPALLVDQSDALRHYPAETLRSAPNVSEASFQWVAGTGSPAPESATLQLATEGRSAGGFASIFADLSDGHVTLGFLLLSLLVAFAFGAQHALGPGHGKTMVAAYLVGSKGTPKHAIALGLTVTATHTSTVYLLGLVTLVAAAWITPETVYLWMGVAAGVMVMAFGLVLVIQRLLSLRRPESETGEHRHGIFGKAHPHAPREEHSHEHPHSHGESHDHPHDHAREHAAAVTWRSLLSLGVLGGLLPCPSAVVVMVAAISQGQVLLGMLLIVAFSLGLAGVLVALGVSLVLGRKIPARQRRLFEHPLVARALTAMPVISAAVVMVVGLGLTYQAVGRV